MSTGKRITVSAAPVRPAHDEPVRGLGWFGLRSALALIGVAAGAAAFLLLLLLVEAAWPPLAALDAGVADDLNELASGSPLLVDVLRVVTDLGGNVIVIYAFVLGTAVLWVRGQRRLAAYLAVTGAGIGVLVPLTKWLIGRSRPEVTVPVSELPSNASFPSGHAALSLVTFGALVLVALPYLRRRWRPWLVVVATVLVAAVGFTRLALGVHFVTDVLSGWALGAAWLAATTALFRGWQHDQGQRTPRLSEGLEQPQDVDRGRPPSSGLPPRGVVGRLALAAAGIVAVLSALGLLVTGPLARTAFGRLDTAGVVALLRVRTETRNHIADLVGMLSDTPAVIGVPLATAALAVAALQRWRPALFVAVAVAGELLLYFVTSEIVGRSRPPVPDLTGGLPTGASWPSGHAAAAVAVYGSLAAVVIVHSAARWRWALVALPAIIAPAVSLVRLYEAAHYPSDVVAGMLLGTAWTLACARLLLLPGTAPPDSGARPGSRQLTAAGE